MNPNFLVTSGGTKIKIDAVRSITNMSRGTFGSKIGFEILKNDGKLKFLYAKGSKLPFFNVSLHDGFLSVIEYETFDDYAARLDEELAKKPDVVILAAAVSDYGVESCVNGKIRSSEELVIRLKPLPKLIATVREKCPDSVICGFKLLVNSTEKELCDAATKSLVDNRLDLVVGNDLRDIKEGQHRLLIVEKRGIGIVTSAHTLDLAEVVVKKCLYHWERKGEKR